MVKCEMCKRDISTNNMIFDDYVRVKGIYYHISCYQLLRNNLDVWKEVENLAYECISKYGYKIQFIIAMEESAEFIQSLSKYLRYYNKDNIESKNLKVVKDNIISEMIDLEIMIEQIKQLFYYESQQFFAYYREILKEKLKRLKEVVNK